MAYVVVPEGVSKLASLSAQAVHAAARRAGEQWHNCRQLRGRWDVRVGILVVPVVQRMLKQEAVGPPRGLLVAGCR